MHLAALAFFFSDFANSPFIVPVAGCIMILGIVAVSVWSGVRQSELRSRERLECIARGMVPPPSIEEIELQKQRPVGSLARRRANIRLSGVVLVATGFGLMAFFIVLTIVLQDRAIFSGAAVSLIPLAIGTGFLIDTKIQSKEIDEVKDAAAGLEPLK